MIKYLAVILVVLSSSTFAGVRSYICDYKSFADQDGLDKPGTRFSLRFVFDTTTKEAMMIGNSGMSPMIVVEGQKQISFIEITSTKNVMITTIDSNQNSVHSRNTVMFGDLIPSQYYGSCTKEGS